MQSVKQTNWYITDANGNLFGNLEGYLRYQDAQRICTRKRYQLWAIYDNRSNTKSNLIYEIKLKV
jgi:hypothetical protein